MSKKNKPEQKPAPPKRPEPDPRLRDPRKIEDTTPRITLDDK